MSTYLETESYVYHMEPDKFIQSNVLFSDGSVLKTTDGFNTTVIAGNPERMGYQNGNNALFYLLTSFKQISSTLVVASDLWNNCLRLIDREKQKAYRYAGQCEKTGFKDGTEEALFDQPRGIISDWKHNGLIFVMDSKNSAIRYVEVSSTKRPAAVTTLFRSSELDWVGYATQHPVTGDIFFTTSQQVYKLAYVSNRLSEVMISGNDVAQKGLHAQQLDPHTVVSPIRTYFKEIIFIDDNTLLVADRSSHVVRVFDIRTNITNVICNGVQALQDGDWNTCSLNRPVSLMILNSILFIGGEKSIQQIKGNFKFSQQKCENQ